MDHVYYPFFIGHLQISSVSLPCCWKFGKGWGLGWVAVAEARNDADTFADRNFHTHIISPQHFLFLGFMVDLAFILPFEYLTFFRFARSICYVSKHHAQFSIHSLCPFPFSLFPLHS